MMIKIKQKSLKHCRLTNNLMKTFESNAFFSVCTTKFKWNFLKKQSTEISKSLHASSKHTLHSESGKKTSGVTLFKTYSIAEVNGEIRTTFRLEIMSYSTCDE